jgi:hypothetical protein
MSITGSNNPFSCSPAINVATNTIIALGTVTRSGNAFTFSVGFVWKINGTIYQNTVPITITVAPTATGFYRIDNAILNTSNSIELQQGLPSNSVALQPVVPETAVLLTSWNISGPSVSDQTEPIVGSTFVKKSFANYLISNVSGEETSIPLNVLGETEIRLTNDELESIASVNILSFSSAVSPELPYWGKPYLIRNLTGNPITIIHDALVSTPNGQRPRIFAFSLKETTDLVVPNNEAVLFHWTDGFMVEIFRSWSELDLSEKADLVNGKVPAAQLPSYVDDVLEFTNLAALPTTGEASKIYVTLDTNKQYRWSGTTYIEFSGPVLLQGSQYTYVYGKGTPTQNGLELQSAYNLAKTISGLSATNRFKIIVGTGKYEFTGQFPINTQFIDFVSLTGDADVEITNGINVTANNVFLKGLVSGLKSILQSFQIATNLNLLICENCIGGDGSFGGFGIASGTFTDCIGGDYSFGGYGIASGTFTDCIGGDNSFGGSDISGTFTNCIGGRYSFGGSGVSGTFTNCIGGDFSFGGVGGSTASGTFTNCIGGDYSFGGSGTASGTFTNCIGGRYSFGGVGENTASGTFTNCNGGDNSFGGGSNGGISGKLYYCRLTAGTFSTVSSGGRTYYCVDGNGNVNNQ